MLTVSGYWRQITRDLCVVLLAILYVQLSVAVAEEAKMKLLPAPKVVPTLPPGFSAPDIIEDPDLWDPGVPGQCNVVYSASIAGTIPYKIQSGGNPVVGEKNYLFYFPVENTVLSFIDPRIARVYPKGVLHGKFGVSLHFEYNGGFPPGFAGLGPLDTVAGNLTYPIPGDKYTRLVTSKWPFIKRSEVLFDYPKHCRFNKDCFCIRKS